MTIHNTTQEAHSKTATQGHDAKWKILEFTLMKTWRSRLVIFIFFNAMLLTAARWWCWSPFSVLLRYLFILFFLEGLEAQRGKRCSGFAYDCHRTETLRSVGEVWIRRGGKWVTRRRAESRRGSEKRGDTEAKAFEKSQWERDNRAF